MSEGRVTDGSEPRGPNQSGGTGRRRLWGKQCWETEGPAEGASRVSAVLWPLLSFLTASVHLQTHFVSRLYTLPGPYPVSLPSFPLLCIHRGHSDLAGLSGHDLGPVQFPLQDDVLSPPHAARALRDAAPASTSFPSSRPHSPLRTPGSPRSRTCASASARAVPSAFCSLRAWGTGPAGPAFSHPPDDAVSISLQLWPLTRAVITQCGVVMIWL